MYPEGSVLSHPFPLIKLAIPTISIYILVMSLKSPLPVSPFSIQLHQMQLTSFKSTYITSSLVVISFDTNRTIANLITIVKSTLLVRKRHYIGPHEIVA
jgi:hypothetical protein